jgi:hypothetical protein
MGFRSEKILDKTDDEHRSHEEHGHPQGIMTRH